MLGAAALSCISTKPEPGMEDGIQGPSPPKMAWQWVAWHWFSLPRSVSPALSTGLPGSSRLRSVTTSILV